MRWIDNFCRKHPRIGIPNLTIILIAARAIVYVLDMLATFSLSSLLVFSPAMIMQGQVWRIITFLFVPEYSDIISLVFSLYFFYFIGTVLEQYWGSAKYTFFYLLGALLTIITGFIYYFITGANVILTYSYIDTSLFFAMATLYPDMRLYIMFLIPVKMKWLAWISAAFSAVSFFMYLFKGNFIMAICVLIPILNYFLFFWEDIRGILTRNMQRNRHSRNSQTVNFRAAAKESKQKKGYLHKCTICGRTDTDFPELEFRYCSKCNGYYCYCSEHINDHVHVQ